MKIIWSWGNFTSSQINLGMVYHVVYHMSFPQYPLVIKPQQWTNPQDVNKINFEYIILCIQLYYIHAWRFPEIWLPKTIIPYSR